MHYRKFQDIIDLMLDRGIHVFNINDVSKLLNKPHKYVSLLINKNKKITKIENGKYYLRGADIYEIASNVVQPSYVSLFSAIRYYNLTTQLPVKSTVITLVRHKPLRIEGYSVTFVTFKKERFFGYNKAGNAYIATLEKTFIDSLYLNAIPYSELREALVDAISRNAINISILKDYATRMDSKVLISRLIILLNDVGIDTKDIKAKASGRNTNMLGVQQGGRK